MPPAAITLAEDLAAELAHVDAALAAALKAQDTAEADRLTALRATLKAGAPGLALEVAAAARSVLAPAVEELAEGWAEAAILAARDGAKRRLDGPSERMALAALDHLGDAAPALARAGSSKVADALGALWEGDEDRARLAWLATGASFDERRRALRDATAFAVQAGDQAAIDWDAVLEAVGRAGLAAFRVGLPFLLAAI